METTIKSRIVTTEETAVTPNAHYELTVTRKNGVVAKVSATVSVLKPSLDAEGVAVVSSASLGTIVYSGGNISIVNIAADETLPIYIGEVLDIIESVKTREE